MTIISVIAKIPHNEFWVTLHPSSSHINELINIDNTNWGHYVCALLTFMGSFCYIILIVWLGVWNFCQGFRSWLGNIILYQVISWKSRVTILVFATQSTFVHLFSVEIIIYMQILNHNNENVLYCICKLINWCLS